MIVHIPIPTEYVRHTAHVWLPFVERIVRRSKNSIPEMVFQIERGDLLVHLAWDPDAKRAHALGLTHIFLQGGKRVGVLAFHWGRDRRKWEHLLPEIEQYHKNYLGCSKFHIHAPLYWERPLEQCGYKTTHHIMEKEL